MDYIVGQRWISEPEPSLGLGIIIHVDARLVEVAFPAKEIVRSYAKRNAPLARVTYDIGEEISHKKGGRFLVLNRDEHEGLVHYYVEPCADSLTEQDCHTDYSSGFLETELDAHLQFHTPDNRLFCGQIDKNKWFELRYETLGLHAAYLASSCQGFAGPRISLIPHQFHIAQSVCQRHQPRVLLADEVGLGKTIEAGLILHHQHCTGVVERALIIVPENLLHQWLVEMARRFNLLFSVFDEERCLSYSDENPFETEQLILCSLDFLLGHPEWQSQLTAAHWDMLIVDEAHHLQWSEEAPSPAYQLIDQLSNNIASVLLLTATPEQFGPAGHFARLKLLDSQRFHDLATFLEEEKHYQWVARYAQAIVQRKMLDSQAEQQLSLLLDQTSVRAYQDAAKSNSDTLDSHADKLLTALIDRHGTGRILFRNTRKNIAGFSQRQLQPIPCEFPNEWIRTETKNNLANAEALRFLLYPEMALKDTQATQWWALDPRFLAIVTLLKRYRHEKFVLICAHTSTVLDIDVGLRVKHGIHAAVFHENLSIIERDRAAAFFADAEENCQILICSEIGSEGRNFQFAHHLILFDLPLHPDLLEQRIGRLDRIGQTQDIQIHVPYFINHPQEKLFTWYHQALNAFEHANATGNTLQTLYQTQLNDFLFGRKGDREFNVFIESACAQNQQLIKQLEEGRDPLLELNSSAKELPLLSDIAALEEDSTLKNWFMRVFDLYGVTHDDGSQSTLIAHPSEHMRLPNFPGLPEEGITLSFERTTALSREDAQFISFDHPMTTGIIELILGQEKGNTALTTLKLPNVKTGTLLLEAIFTLETMAPAIYQANTYLPLQVIRVLIDDKGNNLADKVSFEQLSPRLNNLQKETARAIVKSELQVIKKLLKTARSCAEPLAETRKQQSHLRAANTLNDECQRLCALKDKNPLIRQSEVDFMSEKTTMVLQHIDQAPLHLHAMRLIITL